MLSKECSIDKLGIDLSTGLISVKASFLHLARFLNTFSTSDNIGNDFHIMVSIPDKNNVAVTAKHTMALSQPLYMELQSLSDLCMKVRLDYKCAQAAVLADTIQRHVIAPIRHRLFSSSTTSYRIPAICTSYDDRHTTDTVLKLLTACTSPQVLPLAKVYDMLYKTLEKHADKTETFEVLRTMWVDMLSILRAHMDRWLSHAIVHDTEQEFFITTEGSLFPRTVFENLPQFIPYTIAEMIMFTGRATKCTKLISEDATASLHIDMDPTFKKLRDNPLSATLILESGCVRWRTQAAHHLSKILPFSQIGMRIRHLRDYLLHGNAFFWRHVFDDMRENNHLKLYDGMSEEAQQDVEKALNNALSTAVSEVQGHGDQMAPTEAPFKLHVTSKNEILPQFGLSFAETQVLASRAHIYGDAFSITFGSRQTLCELRAAFAHLLRLERSTWAGGGKRTAGQRMRYERRLKSGGLAQVMELRRRMMCFIEALEWYLQCEVLEPKFDKLLKLINSNDKVGMLRGRPLFDAVTEMHDEMMDDIFKECFIADKTMNIRLNAIFAVCMNLCNFIQSMTLDTVRGKQGDLAGTTASIDVEFSRNVQLFERLLTLQKQGGESKLGCLLLQLNYNDQAFKRHAC